MPTTDPRVDAYIEEAAEFARPILDHLRAVVHRACPHVEETMKWSMPHFTYGGRNVAHMAAFKAHCAFGFWHGEVVKAGQDVSAMGQFGRIGKVGDLPPEAELARMVKASMAIIDSGEKPKRTPKTATQPPPEVPDELKAALRRSARARRTFEAFSPSHQREYVEWIAQAKRPETREKRVLQAVEWMEEGKARHWKYR